MYMNKLLTDSEIYIDVDSEDGDIYDEVSFMIVRVNSSGGSPSTEGVELDIKEAKQVIQQLNSFITRVDKRMATAKVRSKKIVQKNNDEYAK